MRSLQRLVFILAIVATAAIASLITMILAPAPDLNAQALLTTRTPDKATESPGVEKDAPDYVISAYGFIEPKESRKDDTRWTLGFFALNPDNGKVSNCIYMWSGSPMNKCMEYSWVTLP